MKTDKNRPVSSIKHNDMRAAIPDSAHQGEEQMAIIRFRLSFLHISPQPSALLPPSLYITSPCGIPTHNLHVITFTLLIVGGAVCKTKN